jgi:hypothetical protein
MFRGERAIASHSEYAFSDWDDNAAAMEVEEMATKGLMEKKQRWQVQHAELCDVILRLFASYPYAI